MPEIKFPEVKLPDIKLPEGLRDMTREDVQKAMQDAMSDVKLPDVKLPKRSDIAKSVEKALPSRPGPSPVPFAVLAMLGGLIVGWLLATSPLTGPRISAAMGGVRQRIDDWRSGNDGRDDTFDSEPEAFRDAYRSPVADSYGGSLGTDTSVGVGPGRASRKSTGGTSAKETDSTTGVESVGSERL